MTNTKQTQEERKKGKTISETVQENVTWAKKNYPSLKKEFGAEKAKSLLLNDFIIQKWIAELTIEGIENEVN